MLGPDTRSCSPGCAGSSRPKSLLHPLPLHFHTRNPRGCRQPRGCGHLPGAVASREGTPRHSSTPARWAPRCLRSAGARAPTQVPPGPEAQPLPGPSGASSAGRLPSARVPGSSLQAPEPLPLQAAPGPGLPGDAGGRSPPAASAGRPPASYLAASSPGARPRSRGRGRWSCSGAARRGAARRAGSPARGRPAAGPVRGGRRHVAREAGDAGSGGLAGGRAGGRRGPGSWTTAAEKEPGGVSARRGGEGRGGETLGASLPRVELVGRQWRLVLRGPRRGRNRIGGWNSQAGSWGQCREDSPSHQSACSLAGLLPMVVSNL